MLPLNLIGEVLNKSEVPHQEADPSIPCVRSPHKSQITVNLAGFLTVGHLQCFVDNVGGSLIYFSSCLELLVYVTIIT